MAHLGRTLSFIFLLLVALLSIWLSQISKQTVDSRASREPDWIVHSVQGVERDINGEVKYQFTADALTHHPLDDTTSIEKPHFMLNNPHHETWQVTSQRATAYSNNQHIQTIRLEDNVVLTQYTGTKKIPLVMTTRTLTVDVQQKVAETPDPVQFNQGRDNTSAVGMRAYLDRKVIELLSKVRGTYVPNS
jgi:lipopolysaccharide export system protein LptC